ncbi:tyrosine-type recombinase/integrase [Sphingomonas floccifaciens]|uniref:Tyrosine-type recombinase/integrase n=1 Tax=Sphingomonas floccifaciens TaxID=1844115 RepID=A0ABW4NB47_9SPHN
MPLTDKAVQSAKAGPKPRKIADEKGLFVLVQPSGGKLWRLKYRHLGKEKKLSLGRYPEVSLKEARERRDAARKIIADGIDPSQTARAAKIAAVQREAMTFKLVATEYIDKIEAEGRAAVTVSKSRWLLTLLEPSIGHLAVDAITPAELLAALRKVERKGHLETARRMRSLASRVFRYAVATSRAAGDPASVLQGALTAPVVKHHAALIEPAKVGALLRAIDGYDGQPMTKLALKLAPLVHLRPIELRTAKWNEIDIEQAIWRIPASKMKMRKMHHVPLCKQALSILKEAKSLTSRFEYVFSSLYPGTRPMSENTLNAALRRLGYSGDEMTSHGFKSIASTLLNESGLWSSDAIERALAHNDRDTVRAAYHRGQHWDERVRMAQWWADYLDGLRSSIPT